MSEHRWAGKESNGQVQFECVKLGSFDWVKKGKVPRRCDYCGKDYPMGKQISAPAPYSDKSPPARTEREVAMETVIDQQRAEIERLKQWVEDLQGEAWVNCVYCGFRFGPVEKFPVSTTEIFTKHLRQCDAALKEIANTVTVEDVDRVTK